jgi:hypothetical protein
MTWQPIETAPKDGTRVLVYGVPLSYDGSDYGEPAGISVAEYVSHNNAGTEKAWYLPDYYCYDTSYEATHWMPLPSPPEEAA